MGYLWVDGNELITQSIQGTGGKIVDDTVHGYYSSITDSFYSDKECTKKIQGQTGQFYLNISDRAGSGKVYRYTGTGYKMVHRYVQFSSTHLKEDDDPVWENNRKATVYFFRMVEPESGFSPDSFTMTVVEMNGGATVEQSAGSISELRRILSDGELGWCTGDNTLYIKVGNVVRPVAEGGGTSEPVEVRGTEGQLVVTSTMESGVEVFTVSLAEQVVESQVPTPVPGDVGKVLTADDDGKFEWVEPVVETVTTITL